MTGLVPLRAAGARCGSKAATLGRLLAAGFAVPDGVVVPHVDDAGWRRDLPDALRALGAARFAVRSSAAVEDGELASYAGQFRTLLDVPAAGVEGAVQEVAAAGEGGAVYAAALGLARDDRVAVLVQPMLAPVAAGVAFTRDPVTGEPATVVEAVLGRGDRLVAGDAEPERWRVTAGGPARVDHARDVLTSAQARAVADEAARIEQVLGGGQDVEWALGHDGVVRTLQARPLTAPAAERRRPDDASRGRLLTSGTPAAPGAGRGRVRVLAGLDDLAGFRPGEVLVCRATSPAWTPALARAAAVVTEVGGVLSHAAIVARELGVPAVTGVVGARCLPEGALVLVDGAAGTVHRAVAS